MSKCLPHSVNETLRCDYVRTLVDCSSDGFVQYVPFVYCSLGERLAVLAIIICIIWLLILFIGLSVAADSFFCPSLAVITNQLKISENVAGVTFLAFGNGAPDIFAAISSVNGGATSKPDLMFGALLGAGIFVTTVVVGSVTLVKSFPVMQRPFLRDVTFYLWALFFTFYVLYKGSISLGESIGFLVIYLVYVVVVVMGRYVRRWMLVKRGVDVDNIDFIKERQDVPANIPDPPSAINLLESSRTPDEISNDGISNAGFIGDDDDAFSATPGERSNGHLNGSAVPTLSVNFSEPEQSDATPRRNTSTDHRRKQQMHRIDSVLEEAQWRYRTSTFRPQEHEFADLERHPQEIANEVESGHPRNGEGAVFSLEPPPTPLSPASVHSTDFILPRSDSTKDEDEKDENGIVCRLANEIPYRNYPALFWRGVRPFSYEDWTEFKWYGKIFQLIQSPVVLILKFTMPLIDLELELYNWNKPLVCFQFLFCPIFSVIVTQHDTDRIGGVFPLEVVMLILGLILSMLIFFTSKAHVPPVYFKFIAYGGFVMAVIWINALAGEIVNILTMIGVVTGVSRAMLGLTLLAWANSLGDLISDISVARGGFPRMAVSACFGGPLFNLLVGVGVSFTIFIVNKKVSSECLHFSGVQQILVLFLGLSLIISYTFIPFSKFMATRTYAVILLVFYVCFIVVAVLTEQGTIPTMHNFQVCD